MAAHVNVYVCACLRTILGGGSSNIQREARIEPCGTPGASEPSAAPRLIPQQTFQPPQDQPRIDRREVIVWGGVEELEDSFTTAGCLRIVAPLTQGSGSMGGGDFKQKVD